MKVRNPSKPRQAAQAPGAATVAAAPTKPLDKRLTRSETRLLRRLCRALHKEAKHEKVNPCECGLTDPRDHERLPLMEIADIIQKKYCDRNSTLQISLTESSERAHRGSPFSGSDESRRQSDAADSL